MNPTVSGLRVAIAGRARSIFSVPSNRAARSKRPAATAPPGAAARARRAAAPTYIHMNAPRAGAKLDQQIAAWLAAAPARGAGDAAPRAIIGPHAGHRYCGHVMAHAYAAIDPAAV